MAMAVSAPLARITALWSDVTTTTTLRASPSGPRSRSINSRTSRPRSPIRAKTLTSTDAWRAIIPIGTDFPTPLPAKTPSRCPRPAVIILSMDRIPVVMVSVVRRRDIASGGRPSIPIWGRPSKEGPPSRGRPSPSMTRPSS